MKLEKWRALVEIRTGRSTTARTSIAVDSTTATDTAKGLIKLGHEMFPDGKPTGAFESAYDVNTCVVFKTNNVNHQLVCTGFIKESKLK